MSKKQVAKSNIVIGVILLLPAFFFSGFALRKALLPTMTCKQACEALEENFVGCDDDLCLCRPQGTSMAEHIEGFDDGETRYKVECTE